VAPPAVPGAPEKERYLFEQVLLLNASYEPLNVINWERAIKLVFLNKVEVVEESAREVRSITVSMKVPSVVRLMGFVRFRRKDAKYSRRNIYARDKYRCQYCGKPFPPKALTCDHVIPRSRGGRAEWDNIVTCCVPCNRRKGGQTPDEAGLVLIKRPTRPTWYWGFQIRFANNRPPAQWWMYLRIYLEDEYNH
jgi:5-methylcytosine-specific restriction endonuclease McrA